MFANQCILIKQLAASRQQYTNLLSLAEHIVLASAGWPENIHNNDAYLSSLLSLLSRAGESLLRGGERESLRGGESLLRGGERESLLRGERDLYNY